MTWTSCLSLIFCLLFVWNEGGNHFEWLFQCQNKCNGFWCHWRKVSMSHWCCFFSQWMFLYLHLWHGSLLIQSLGGRSWVHLPRRYAACIHLYSLVHSNSRYLRPWLSQLTLKFTLGETRVCWRHPSSPSFKYVAQMWNHIFFFRMHHKHSTLPSFPAPLFDCVVYSFRLDSIHHYKFFSSWMFKCLLLFGCAE